MTFSYFGLLIFCVPLTLSQLAPWPPTSCDGLVPEHCGYPYPNNYYLQMDSNYNPQHLVIPMDMLPIDKDGITINPQQWNIFDGFTALPPILLYFDDLNIENCAQLWNIETSLNDDSPVIILKASTGERIPHWVELDHLSDNIITGNQINRTMMIWPAYRLDDSERYIIALRNLYTNENNRVQLSDAWIALRDNTTTNDLSVNEQRRFYFKKQIFDVLEMYNINYKTLDLAFDFTVMSSTQQTKRFITMRDDAFNRLQNDYNNNVKYNITSIDNNYDNKNIARKINGYFTVPLYLNMPNPSQHVRLVTTSNDPLTPIYQGEYQWEFEILIPNSVANDSLIGRYLQYGHGLFNTFDEIENEYLKEEANEYGYILAATTWIGMSEEDVPYITQMVRTNLTNFEMIPDRCHQGMLNALFLMKLLISDNFLNDESLLYFDNTLVVNPNLRNYYGNSQGGILGGVYMSVTTDVINGVLGVPGVPYSLLLPRSCDFDNFLIIVKNRYRNNFDRIFLFNIIELLWTRMEPLGFINHLNNNLFPNTPTHNVLIHYSLGDAQCTWLAAYQMGRTLNSFMYVSQVPEYNETIYGFNYLNDSDIIELNGNTVLTQGWNYNLPPVPFYNRPPDCNTDSHEYTRRQKDSQQASNAFFVQNIVYNSCNGPCNGQIPNN